MSVQVVTDAATRQVQHLQAIKISPGSPLLTTVWLVSLAPCFWCTVCSQSLKRLAAQLRMKEPSIIKADFDRPAYAIPANKQMPAGWQSLRQFIVVEHPQYAHIIDNKLMDQVGGCTLGCRLALSRRSARCGLLACTGGCCCICRLAKCRLCRCLLSVLPCIWCGSSSS